VATTKKSNDDGDREDGIVTVKDADGRVHFTAAGSAAERNLNASRDKANKGEKDATPAVTEG
jgi:hypothetical protein